MMTKVKIRHIRKNNVGIEKIQYQSPYDDRNKKIVAYKLSGFLSDIEAVIRELKLTVVERTDNGYIVRSEV